MPALVLFGRKWQVGTDDFVVSSFVDLLIRLIWLIAGVAIFWKNEPSLHCPDAFYTRIFYYGFFTLAHCNIILDILLLQNSRKGSVMDSSPRKYVPLILYLRVAVQFIEITWNILATIGMYQKYFHYCDITASSLSGSKAEPILLIHALIIFDWIALFFQLLIFLYLFDPLGRSSTPYDEYKTNSSSSFQIFGIEMPLVKSKYAKIWQRRCRCILCSCCCVKDAGVLDSYREVAKIFGTMLAEDLVLTDVLAGLVLLSLKTKEEREREVYQVIVGVNDVVVKPRSRSEEVEQHMNSIHSVTPVIKKDVTSSNGMLLNPISITEVGLSLSVTESGLGFSQDDEKVGDDAEVEWKSPVRIHNFVRFACAAYGYVYPLMYQELSCPIPKLIKNCMCCSCLPGKKHPVDFEGDNCCACCLSGVKTTLKDIPFEDIVYASFKDSTFVKPFYIALDHRFKSIVVACRGTLSFKDGLTDMTGWPSHIPGYPLSFKAHHGMLLSCQRLKEKLNRLRILDELLAKYPDYGLVLTGQSLGAGMATILSLLIRPQYPHLKCYVFSSPGGLLSNDAAEYCKAFLITVIYGDDFVSRLGILQFERLKIKLMTALRECKTPKYRLLLGGYCCLVPSPKLEHIPNSDHHSDEPTDETKLNVTVSSTHLQETSSISIPNSTRRLRIISSNYESKENDIKYSQAIESTKFPTIEGMYPPGNIFYVTKSDRSIEGPKYVWRWADRHEFDDIVISSKMLLDHIPITMPEALRHVAYPE